MSENKKNQPRPQSNPPKVNQNNKSGRNDIHRRNDSCPDEY